MKKIAFAWWGSGWHIFPIKSLIEYFSSQNPELQIFWFGEKNSMEEGICKQLEESGINVKFVAIMSGKVRRYWTLKAIWLNLVDIFKLKIGFFQSLYYLRKYKIDTLFSKWGSVSLPPSIAARILRKQVYMHESDTVPWLANRVVGKFANKIFLGLETVKEYFPKEKTQLVGQILGEVFYKERKVNKCSELSNLLLIGGSQWAAIILDALLEIASNHSEVLANYNITIIWGTLNKQYGEKFVDYKNIKFLEFVSQEEMAEILTCIDMSITRWSGTSLAEQDLFGIWKIIIPLPFTGGNHQYRNAVDYVKRGDVLVEQKGDLKGKLLELLREKAGFKKTIAEKWEIINEKIEDSKGVIYESMVS